MPTRHLKRLLLSFLVMLMMLSTASSKDIAFEVVEFGQMTELKGGATYILRSENELKILFVIHGQSNVPSIDFQKEMLVGIFAGERADPSHYIRIKSIYESDDWMKVTYSEKEARSDNKMRVYPQMVVNPFVIFKIKKTDKFIIFDVER